MRPVGVTYTPTAGYSGADSMRVTISDGVTSSTSTFRIVVNPKPSAPLISGPSSVCSGNTITLTGTPSGGFFGSMDGNTSTNATTGVVTTRGIGSSTIYYNSTYNSYGCRTQSRTTISVIGYPAPATLSGLTSVCPGGAVTWTPSVSGGTWSSAGPSIVTVTGAGSVIGVTSGSALVRYTVNNGCFSATASRLITVSGATSVPAIDGASYFYLPSTLSVSNTLAGGSWTSSDTSVAVISSSGVIRGIRPGTDTIIYTFTNGCGISSSVSKSVRVLSRGGKFEPNENDGVGVAINGLHIFPNPTTALVTIELSGVTGTLDVALLDNAGRTVLVLNGISTRSVLDLSQLPSGEYLVNVKSGGDMYSGKIVVK